MYLVSSIVPYFIVGLMAAAGVFGMFMLVEGFFVIRDNLPKYWIWAYYLAFHTYSFDAFMYNEVRKNNRFSFQHSVWFLLRIVWGVNFQWNLRRFQCESQRQVHSEGLQHGERQQSKKDPFLIWVELRNWGGSFCFFLRQEICLCLQGWLSHIGLDSMCGWRYSIRERDRALLVISATYFFFSSCLHTI